VLGRLGRDPLQHIRKLHLRNLWGVLELGCFVGGWIGRGDKRINACAECGASFFAVAAAAVGDVEGHYDAVAFLEKRDAGASLEDYAHVLMS
jgi:hypothetical protein